MTTSPVLSFYNQTITLYEKTLPFASEGSFVRLSSLLGAMLYSEVRPNSHKLTFYAQLDELNVCIFRQAVIVKPSAGPSLCVRAEKWKIKAIDRSSNEP